MPPKALDVPRDAPPKIDDADWAASMRAWCAWTGLPQWKIAVAFKVSPFTVNSWVNGHTVPDAIYKDHVHRKAAQLEKDLRRARR